MTRQGEPAAKAAQHRHGETRQLIGFTIGSMVFATDILSVHEILRSAPLTTVPNAPPYVEGLIQLGGNIFPLIDFRKKMGIPGDDSEKDSWIIVLEVQGMLTGIKVDTVTRVLEVDQDNIKSMDPDSALDPFYCPKSCSIGDGEIILPDFTRIFADAREKAD